MKKSTKKAAVKNLKRNLSVVIAALIVIAVAVTYFVWTLVKEDPENINGLIIDKVDGVWGVNPSDELAVPSEPPNLEQPTTPPPAE